LAVALVAVMVAATARAAVLTVGPGGSHHTIQAAIDVALANGEDDEIRVQAGTYRENLTLAMASGSLLISGGWNSKFDCGCGETRVDADRRGRALALQVSGGSLAVRKMGFIQGVDTGSVGKPGFGGGIKAAISGGTVTIADCAVRDNAAGAPGRDAMGGGIGVELTGSGRLRLTGNEIADNRVSDGLTYGAGMYLVSRATSDGASFEIDGNHIMDNRGISRSDLDPACGSDPQHCAGWLGASWGGGILVELPDDGGHTVGEVNDNLVEDNRLEMDRDPVGNVRATAIDVRSTGLGNQTTLLRNHFLDNSGSGSSFVQVMLAALHGSLIRFGDSVVADSNVGGMYAGNVGEGTVLLTNLTIADNRGWVGLAVNPWRNSFPPRFGPSLFSLANSIILSPNGVPLLNLVDEEGTSFVMTSTTVGKRLDVKFRNKAGRDYRLTRRSIAVDKGKPNPPGGLGPSDVVGGPRKRGRSVDQGAYESY
jgi:hypothetical protein